MFYQNGEAKPVFSDMFVTHPRREMPVGPDR